MRVLLVERHTSPTVSLYIRYLVGAVDDGEGKTGAAHFLEHMLFKGTSTIGTKNFKEEERVLKKIREAGTALDRERMKGTRADEAEVTRLAKELKELQSEAKEWIVENEIDRLYSENGAVDLNASTGQDVTTYKVSLPANRIELWARIEADRMTNPVLREFYTERDVVMEERRQTYESVPSRKLMELFLATAFTASPYRRPVIGWASDISFLDAGLSGGILQAVPFTEQHGHRHRGRHQHGENDGDCQKIFWRHPISQARGSTCDRGADSERGETD